MHGYDLLSVAFIDALHFVSIADEKVARVFEAPQEFVDIVHNLDVADLRETAVRTLWRLFVCRYSDLMSYLGGTSQSRDCTSARPLK